MNTEHVQQLDPAGVASLPGPASELPPPPPPSAGAQPKTPECDRLVSVADESHKLGEFLDWLEQRKRLSLARWSRSDDQLVPDYTPKEQLLAEYYGIDLDKVDAERRALLKHVRSLHG